MPQTARELVRLGRRQALTREGNALAKDNFDQARTAESQYLPAFAEGSYILVREYQNDWGDGNRTDSLAQARALADEAVVLSNNSSNAMVNDFRAVWYSAIVSWNEGNFDRAFQEYKDARALITDEERIAKDTSDLDADMAEACIYNGQPDRAIALVLGALELNPDPPDWYLWNLGRAYYMAGRYQDAIDAIAEMTNPPNDVRLITAASHAQLAYAVMAEFKAIEPQWTLQKSADYKYGDENARAHWLEGLSRAGLE